MLSKEAVKRFVEIGMPDKNKCREDHGGAEDVEIGKFIRIILYVACCGCLTVTVV